MIQINTYKEFLSSKPKKELSLIYYDCLGKKREEIRQIFLEHDIEISDKLIDEFLEDNKGVSALSEDTLQATSGGTIYENGWDGVYRPIVTILNNCYLFQKDLNAPDDEICENCCHYSYNKNGVRISLFSGWCTRHNRVKGHDVVNGEEPLPL